MSPTRQVKEGFLFEETRKLRNLRDAWQTVRFRALNSPHEPTRSDAQKVEADAERYLSRLQKSLGRGEFSFAPQRGVAKRRTGKAPRPLVIAPVGNRIVQRAILNICQSDVRRVQGQLGQLPSLIATPTSVGGLPEKGVRDAARQIREAIDRGARHFVRSDIKEFFTQIETSDLRDFLQSNVRDEAFIRLFLDALSVDLENKDEVSEWLSLFPSDDRGVPQGSSLSALCANIALRHFDAEMNGRGITTIRYLDDFVILGASRSATVAAWESAKQILNDAGFSLHEPSAASAKAAEGMIEGGFEFLSLRFDLTSCLPTSAAKEKLFRELDALVKAAKAHIVKNAAGPRRAEPMFTQSLALIDRKIRGWGDAFECCTDRLSFHQLDDKIDRKLSNFLGWWARYSKDLHPKQRRRALGIALLSDTPREATS